MDTVKRFKADVSSVRPSLIPNYLGMIHDDIPIIVRAWRYNMKVTKLK